MTNPKPIFLKNNILNIINNGENNSNLKSNILKIFNKISKKVYYISIIL